MHRSPFTVLLLLTGLALVAPGRGVEAAPAADGDTPTVVLSTARCERAELGIGTIWRYFETWQSDVAQVGGKLVNVNIYDNRQKADGGKGDWVIKEPKHLLGSPFPADGWQKPEFDDSGWVRHAGPFPSMWRSLALLCLRGKFQAPDPAQVSAISLSLKFQGGVVAYLNGQEVGRAFLPEGRIDNGTLAQEYPQSAYVDAKNNPIPQLTYGARILAATGNIPGIPYELKTADTVTRFKSRGRTLDVKIPPGLLKKGTNVLAIEIHRAPADPIMYTTQDLTPGNRGNLGRCWNRAGCEDVTLTVTEAAGAVVPNLSRPEGVQVWTEETMTPLNFMRYGDPSEPLTPIQLCGAKNGTYAGQVLVGARGPIRNLKADARELTCGKTTIPASALQVYYSDLASDALDTRPPAEKLPPAAFKGRYSMVPIASLDKPAAAAVGAVAPVWLAVQVPRDAPAGRYTGTLLVQANGEKPVAVPVELKVVGDWVLPDPRDFTTFVAVHESADSLAMQYNVPLWSEEHWKYIDAVYQLLGQIGVKDVYLPLIAKTHLANEQSMVRWIKHPDGTYTYDFSILERYLDTALKHLGKVPVVCLYLHDYGFRIEQNKNRGGNSDHDGGLQTIKPFVTALDPATGQLSEFQPPDWGTPEALAFWKPVIDKTRERLAKRGVEKSLMFGMGANNWVRAETCSDLKTLYPDVLWVNRTHYFTPNVGDGKAKQPVGLASVVAGVVGVCYDPEETPLKLGWKAPNLTINFPRLDNVEGAVFNDYLATYRIFAEGVLLSGGMRWNALPPSRGVGHIGADFWPVVKSLRGGPPKNLADRYVFWHSLSLADVVPSILAPGANGPVGTVRHQLMREALQEAEARILVQNALSDPRQTAQLGPELTKRCTDLCAERTQVLRYYTKFAQPALATDFAKVFSQHQWDALSEKLYQAAGDVAQATGKK